TGNRNHFLAVCHAPRLHHSRHRHALRPPQILLGQLRPALWTRVVRPFRGETLPSQVHGVPRFGVVSCPSAATYRSVILGLAVLVIPTGEPRLLRLGVEGSGQVPCVLSSFLTAGR